MIHIPREVTWWYWLLTVVLLAVSLAGWTMGLVLASGLMLIQVIHFGHRAGSPTSFPVQVRVAYLGLLVVGMWAPLAWVHWVQLLGTAVRVALGYCLLARIVSLMPWNRNEPVTVPVLKQTFLRLKEMPPCGGWMGEGQASLWLAAHAGQTRSQP